MFTFDIAMKEQLDISQIAAPEFDNLGGMFMHANFQQSDPLLS